MDVNLKFLGGAKSVTGSRYLLEIDEERTLIDCGLFQGLKELRLRNWDNFPVDVKSIDRIILTHAHLDHSGYIPKLVKEGFNNPIYCTEATYELLKILWKDSAKLQEDEASFAKKKGFSKHQNPKPLYDSSDVEKALPLLRTVKFSESIKVSEQLSFKIEPAGHILGAGSILMTVTSKNSQKTILFSGDLGRENDPILNPPHHFKKADIVLIEATYGDRISSNQHVLNELKHHINKQVDKGVILIPAFTVGRTQNLLYYLHQLMDSGEIDKLPVYIDSPMAISVTDLYNDFSNQHKLTHNEIFNYSWFNYIRDSIASKELHNLKTKAIIISASGMCTGGRILHHLHYRLRRKNDMVLFVGYQAEGTRGRDMLENKNRIKLFGTYVDLRCKIEQVGGLSAHADQAELLSWYASIEDHPKYTFIVHSEEKAANAFKAKLEANNYQNSIIPNYLETFKLFEGI